MTTDQPQKICVLCGEDCSQRPRIKDPRGRYYCKHCYDDAQNAVEARKALEETPPDLVLPEEPPPVEAAATPPTGCPGCGRRMDAGAVICTNCGYNTRTGVTVQPTIEAPVGPGPTGATKRTVWPMVIGIFSILFGAGGVLLHGLDLVLTVLVSIVDWDGRSLFLVSVSMIDLLLAVWLLAAGIGLVVRRPRAAESIRRWAVVKIVLYTIFFGVSAVGLLAIRDTVDWIALELGLQPGDLGVAPVLIVMVIALAWFLLWPVFVLIWFARAPVQTEVDAW